MYINHSFYCLLIYCVYLIIAALIIMATSTLREPTWVSRCILLIYVGNIVCHLIVYIITVMYTLKCINSELIFITFD